MYHLGTLIFWAWRVAFGKDWLLVSNAACSSDRLLLFPLEEGDGEPWFPALSKQQSCTFLLPGLDRLALIVLGDFPPAPVAEPGAGDDLGVMQEPAKDGAGCRRIAQVLIVY